ncbi:MAG: glycosyltransferase [Eubacteriales bacterium]|nr:glycosyltransferase [Eubacteriales bacterium]
MDEKGFYQRTNHFQKYHHISSRLVLGSLDTVSNPFISIAIPTYRRIDTLKEAIDSVLTQTPVNLPYEILVVDDEPIPGNATERLIRSYDNPLILYYRHAENLGMFSNWNRCIELSRGKWVAFLHDDDLLKPYYLEKACYFLTEKLDKNAVYLHCQYDIMLDFDNRIYLKHASPDGLIKEKLKACLRDKLTEIKKTDAIIKGQSPVAPPSCGTLIRRDAALEIGGFDESYWPSADGHLSCFMLDRYKVYSTNIPMGDYRLAINTSFRPDVLAEMVRVDYYFRQYLHDSNLLSRIFGKFFQTEFLVQSIDEKIDFAALADKIETVENLDFTGGYKRNPLKLFMLKLIQKIHYRYRNLCTLLWG